jgi:cysteine-rich repeat protein
MLIDNCAVYGFSSLGSNAAGCTNDENARIITCKVGYYPLGGSMSDPKINLAGTTPFQGCVPIDECVLYGYNNRQNYTKSCVDLDNGRTITCNTGYAAVDPNITSVTLTGNAIFYGCTKINTCQVYGTSGHPQYVESCVQRDVNNRTITCLDGYAVKGYGELPMLQMTGPVTFPGCVQVDMCKVYGASNRTSNVLSCSNGINNRTLVCESGYHIKSWEHNHMQTEIPPPYWTQITITGYDAFYGCFPVCGDGIITPGENCDDGNDASGDGCYGCLIEDGFDCGAIAGEECCFAGEFYDYLTTNLGLVCVDGWWMAPFHGYDEPQSTTNHKKRLYDSFTINLGDYGQDFTMTQDYLKLCGSVVITNNEVAITGSATLYVAGPIWVQAGGTLTLTTSNNGTHWGDNWYGDSRIYLEYPCAGFLWYSEDEDRIQEDAGLHVLEGGTIQVVQDSAVEINAETDMSATDLFPLISMYGCAEMLGTYSYIANDDGIPQEDNHLPLTNSTNWQDCIFNVDLEDVTTTLPSCPIVLLELNNQWVVMTTATRRMCAGSIGGLVVGTTAAVAAAGAAGALLLGSGGSSAGSLDYVTL